MMDVLQNVHCMIFFREYWAVVSLLIAAVNYRSRPHLARLLVW